MFELGRMLCRGELIGKLKTLLDEPFDLSFQPICDVHASLTLKAPVMLACGNEDAVLRESIVLFRDCVSTLNDPVEYFQCVLDQFLVGHPVHPAALTNLARARL
ncbi:uncharacterized protein EDB91DRAFT_1255625 [Suillus paluster]|uniref:uncharacterized protein n=1 Tax=Suillus paluster TaxID=48578 RepID=UPI001B869D4C|nr:uncharacterized protein EDB91DRAFT_1255625 [Suillus paluster]KAG1723477.1 hypothetical protein EDB91DRAFT_1255625 [Suillus paluster]